ncbi:CU044_5270 family protein [Cellulomonas soli]|uniref:Uncharacterized protein n=1 Tax=Cellulomonas soli TaxID=931535 RepID=A0A512PEI1_9CELL|nr:CU044_5270 family protein [Cellulomonas soli]NYI58888.1 hypothetical protein [Cellulomonas soli]GEP69619.1 hypothetical protein CSO01_23340 [Cellulomonas soli]
MTPADDDALALRRLASELGLGATHPPDRRPADEPHDGWAEAMLERVMSEELVSTPAAPQRPVAALPVRHRRRPLGLVAACLAVLAAITGVVISRPAPAAAVAPILAFSDVDPASLAPTSGAPARAELLAIAASAQVSEPAPHSPSATAQHVVADQWRLEIEVGGEVTLTIRPTHQDSWLYADGQVRVREVATAARFDESGQQVGADRDGDVTRDDLGSSEGRGALWAQQLPRDPAELTDLLLRGSEDVATDPTRPSVVLTGRIVDLFGTWVVPPDLAASLWTALAQFDDVRDLGDVTDRAGRAGRAFSVWDENTQTLEVLIVDTTTGALLGREGVLFAYPGVVTDQQLSAPRVGYFTTFLSSTWTDAG